jgi:effector-binding domain-containing protein
MSHLCEIKQYATQSTLSVRTRASVQQLSQVLGKVYGSIAQYLGELGEAPAGAPFVAYYNMDMQNLDMEIGFPVAKPLPGKGEIHASQIPAGLRAACVHEGPYQEVGTAYETLTKFVHDRGYKTSGIAYEFYLNDPAQTAPQDLRTQVMFLLVAETHPTAL